MTPIALNGSLNLQDRTVCVNHAGMYVYVPNRYRSVVDRFFSLDLEDKDLDLQRFMKEELLPSAEQLLNRS